MKVAFVLNGMERAFSCDATASLLDVLRSAGMSGVKLGCREGVCGACTVLVDGRAVASCAMLAGLAEGRRVETVEGLGTVDHPHPLQRAFVEESAVQCGYCTPGVLMSAKALLQRDKNPPREEIIRAIDGNLCRCTGYVKIVRGIERAAAILREEGGAR